MRHLLLIFGIAIALAPPPSDTGKSAATLARIGPILFAVPVRGGRLRTRERIGASALKSGETRAATESC